MISGLFQEHVPRSPPSPWRPSAGACCLATSPACSSARTTRATSARSNSVINTPFWSNASLYSRRGLVLHSQINKDLVPPSFVILSRAAIVNPPQNSSDFLPPSFKFSFTLLDKKRTLTHILSSADINECGTGAGVLLWVWWFMSLHDISKHLNTLQHINYSCWHPPGKVQTKCTPQNWF